MEVKTVIRDLVLIAILSAASFAGRVVMAVLPGVQPTTVIIIVTTLALGLKHGLAVAILSTVLSNMHLGHGSWTLFQILGWSAVAVASFLFGKTPFKQHLYIGSIFAGLMGMLFGALVSLDGLLYGFKYRVYYLAGLPHDLSHALGNVIIYFVLGNRLLTLLKKHAQAYYRDV